MTVQSFISIGRRASWQSIYLGALALAVAALFFWPIFYMIAMSLRTAEDIMDTPLGLPLAPTLDNYRGVLSAMAYWRSIANTIVITVSTTLLVSLLSSLAAYPLARLRGLLSTLIYLFLTLGLTIPLFIGMTPLYILLRDLHLLNTYVGVIIAYTALNLPLGVFFYTSFLKSIPQELEDAAVIDGCNAIQVYWHVILPLLRPITGTIALFVTLSVWNDLVYPLLLLTDESKFTITVAVFRFLGTHNIDPTKLFPASVLGSLPMLILFFVLQRQIVSGISAGAVKG